MLISNSAAYNRLTHFVSLSGVVSIPPFSPHFSTCECIPTLAPPNAIQGLKPGKLLSFTHSRSISTASSSRVAGFPCCIATAPSTFEQFSTAGPILQPSSDADASTSANAIAVAQGFFKPHPRFDWRPRARSQLKSGALPAPKAISTEGSAPNKRPNRVTPPQVPLFKGEPFFSEVQACQEQYVRAQLATYVL